MIKSRKCWIQRQKEMSKYIGMRKHSSQFKKSEKESLMKRLRSIDKWSISTHALKRIREKGIDATYNDIASTVHDCMIFEYKIDYNRFTNRCEERIGVRSNSITNKNFNLNVIYSLTNKKVITVWLNRINDNHATLDKTLYDANLKIFNI